MPRSPWWPTLNWPSNPPSYTALPDDWVLGVADVVTSTEALEAGRYKAVNTAGAAVISAVSNALGTLDFPFVFTGDGASFAVGPEDAEVASEALAATIAWVGAELGLGLRGAVVPVRAIRSAGSRPQGRALRGVGPRRLRHVHRRRPRLGLNAR